MLSDLFESDDTTPAKPQAAPYTPSPIIGASIARIASSTHLPTIVVA